MTKLTAMDLPGKDTPMYYCEKCDHYVPDKKKHNRKRHEVFK